MNWVKADGEWQFMCEECLAKRKEEQQMSDAKVAGQAPQISNEVLNELLDAVLAAVVRQLRENPAVLDQLVKFLLSLLVRR